MMHQVHQQPKTATAAAACCCCCGGGGGDRHSLHCYRVLPFETKHEQIQSADFDDNRLLFPTGSSIASVANVWRTCPWPLHPCPTTTTTSPPPPPPRITRLHLRRHAPTVAACATTSCLSASAAVRGGVAFPAVTFSNVSSRYLCAMLPRALPALLFLAVLEAVG